mgnify:CR=1 FL=1
MASNVNEETNDIFLFLVIFHFLNDYMLKAALNKIQLNVIQKIWVNLLQTIGVTPLNKLIPFHDVIDFVLKNTF